MGARLTDTAGDRLRQYIEGVMADRDIDSVSELARRAHVSRDTFQAWWRGRPPQRSTAELVARVLGVTYADLIAAREGFMEPAGGNDTLSPAGSAFLERIAIAVEAQVRATNGLLAELRASRRGRDDLAERVNALWAAAKLQDRPGAPTDDGTPARRAKAG